MRLSEEEYYQYLAIHPKLIYYAGKKMQLIPSSATLEEFSNYAVKEKLPSREALYDNIHLLDDYLKEHSENLSEEAKEIIEGFKHFRRGTFYIVKLTKKYAYFLGEKYVYGVHALNDPFEMFWGNKMPVMVKATLLPYKGKIIYDGIISEYPMYFGKGMASSLKNNATLAEGKYGLITELPEKANDNVGPEQALLLLMKTKSSREHNWYEIEGLLEAHPELIPIYIKEWGRINSRNKKKAIREMGIKKRWFAMYNDTIILSGKSEKELRMAMSEIIPDATKREGVYYFKV